MTFASCLKKAVAVLVMAITFVSSAQPTQQLFLSGHSKDDAVPWKFFCTAGANSGVWTNLPVPSQWDAKGFGTLNYSKDATNLPPESGLYEHDFTVPADWSGQRLFLVFEGAMTDTSAKLNGESVGPMHQGSFYRFKYDVTKLVKPGAVNRLEVRVDKHSANKSVNAAERTADYWVFGGIFRPVHLDAVPPQFIERVAIDAQADGSFALDVFADGIASADSVEAQIKTLAGQPVGEKFTTKLVPHAKLKTQVAAPKLWTAETPNLYLVEVTLKQGDQVIHQLEQRFGFRTMEVREGDGLYVNGHKVILKGANRHSFWPDSGRCLSETVHRLDIETMKDMNMNAVRMSHYPPDAQFLDLCDELGLYVLDELAGWHGHYDTEVGTILVEEMVTRDVNHPCILFWDNGNEGGWNTKLDTLYGQFDPQQRQVLHPWTIHGGVNTGHYKSYETAQLLCASNTIYMPTEFEHGLFDGGAGAGLEDYWNLMSHSKVCAGGFIWSLLDEGVKRPDSGEIDVQGNQAPDGILGPYREREGSFYTIKQIWSPIQVTRATDGKLTVENHYSFTDANQCNFQWELRKFHRPNQATAGFSVVAKGKISTPAIPPGGQATIQPELPAKAADALALRVTDPTGRELWTWVWPLRQPDTVPAGAGIAAQAENFGGTNTGIAELKSRDMVVRIDRQTGELTEVERAGKKFSLNHGPRVVATGSTLKKVAWQLRDDGWLQCDYTYAATGAHEAFGVAFDYPEKLVRGKRWLGNGPYRVWKNRLPGTTLGVWENAYNNTITGWRGWEYPEFKGCFADVYWMQLQTAEGNITAVPARQNMFVQVLTPKLPPDKLVAKTKTTLPQVGLAFLDAIPPMGSKFHNAKDSGPQGQANLATGEYSGSVSFYFGNTGTSNNAAAAVNGVPPAMPNPTNFPGQGVAQHPFLYAGEWDTRKPLEQSMFIVRDGKIAWQYSMPIKNAVGGIQEFDDATLLENGNVIFSRMSGAGMISPDKKMVWDYPAPPGTEIHSCQSIGKDRVLIMRNGNPAQAMIFNTASNILEQEIPIPTPVKGTHGQFRHIRMTPAGTLLVPHLGEGKVVEYDLNGKVLWTVAAKSPWQAVRLKNGNTLIAGDHSRYAREVNPQGETVWEFTQADVPNYTLGNIQTADRLANGNTVVCCWIAGDNNAAHWPGTVQVFEVTAAKQIVWALSSWDKPDLGPATSIQLLDEPGPPEQQQR